MSLTQLRNLGIVSSAGITTTKLGTGAVLQVVQTFKSDTFSSTGSTFTDITGLSVSITPSSSSNKILILCTVAFSPQDDSIVQLLRGSTAIGIGTSGTNTNGFAMMSATTNTVPYSTIPMCINYLDSPSTTSSTTYKIQAKGNGATWYINRRAVNDAYCGSSTLTAIEIKA